MTDQRDELVEAVARAICEARGVSPDCLHQHNFEGDYPEDERREYTDPFTGETRVQLFHRGWRNREKDARAIIPVVLEQAAKVAEKQRTHADAGTKDTHTVNDAYAAGCIDSAQAIRQLTPGSIGDGVDG